MMFPRTIILVLLGAATGCTTAPSRTAVHYVCDRSGDLHVNYERATAVVRTSDGIVHRLPQVPAGSGTHYSSGTHDWRRKGVEGMWSVGRMAADTCRMVPQPR